MRLFGFGKKKQKAPADSEIIGTITTLKQNLEQLEKRQEQVQIKCDNELKQAKAKNQAGNKKQAVFHMKKKKLYEAEIEKLEGAKLNLEQQIFAIEGTQTNKQIFDSMQKGNQLVTNMTKQIDIKKVDKLKDDMEEN